MCTQAIKHCTKKNKSRFYNTFAFRQSKTTLPVFKCFLHWISSFSEDKNVLSFFTLFLNISILCWQELPINIHHFFGKTISLGKTNYKKNFFWYQNYYFWKILLTYLRDFFGSIHINIYILLLHLLVWKTGQRNGISFILPRLLRICIQTI